MTMNDLNKQNLKGSYNERIQKTKEDANQTESIAKKLEMEEQMLVQRLQQTYDREKRAVQKLYEANAKSPMVQKSSKPGAPPVKDYFFK